MKLFDKTQFVKIRVIRVKKIKHEKSIHNIRHHILGNNRNSNLYQLEIQFPNVDIYSLDNHGFLRYVSIQENHS